MPFLRFFTGAQAGRKHGFAVGEVTAGRVSRIEGGAIVVDLFGKALAVADEFEPREVPPAPAPQAPVEAAEGASEASDTAAGSSVQASAGAAEAAAGEADVAEAAPEAPTDATAEPEAALEPELADAAEAVATAATEAAEAATVQAEVAPEAPDAEASATIEEPAEAGAEVEASEASEASEEPAEAQAAEAAEAGGIATSGAPLTPAPVVPEDLPRPEAPSMGAIFRGRIGAISESGHIAIVNRNIDRQAVKAQLERYRVERRRVEGVVYGFNRGGFDVLVAGIRAFCPATAMSLGDIDDPNEYVGKKYEFLLPSSQSGGKNIIVSRRSILERLQRKQARELLRSLEPGQRLKGKVTHVREFGVFVDIGGVEGLVHQSELSYAHGTKPADICSAGDELEVQVLKVGGEPKKSEGGGRRDRTPRVSLSVKALQPDPWQEHAELLREGSVREGKVTRTTEFGAFIELAPSIEGLLHISELGRDLQHANQAVQEGEAIHVVVERADRKARRISLSRLGAAELEEFKAGKLQCAGKATVEGHWT